MVEFVGRVECQVYSVIEDNKNSSLSLFIQVGRKIKDKEILFSSKLALHFSTKHLCFSSFCLHNSLTALVGVC